MQHIPSSLHQGHIISELERDPGFILEGLRQTGITFPGTICGFSGPPTIAAEEAGMADQEALVTWDFDRNRQRILETLKAIPSFLFHRFSLPRENGLDIGCGSTGFMRHTLLDEQVRHHSWAEIDANPHAVADNSRLHPDSPIHIGSYHQLDRMGLNEKMDIITGLSTLDATAFMDHAMDQIAGALKPNGWFLHIQDVRPGLGTCFQALEKEGCRPPYKMRAADRSGRNVVSFEVQGENLSVVELFRRRIGQALDKTPSLAPVLNTWVVAKRRLQPEGARTKHPGVSKTYYMNMLLEHIAYPKPTEEAYAVVTLARKK